jgi:hypothetical protein
VPQDIKVSRNSLPGTTCQARNKTTTIMSKARSPKRKEQEYVTPDEVKDFHSEILKAGMHLMSVSSAEFPNAELVSNAMDGVCHVVGMHNLAGKCVTSCVSNAEREYVMTKEICSVSIFAFSFLINIMHNLSLLTFLQITLQAIINCMEKSNKCFETDPNAWRAVNECGLQLLLLPDLARYHCFPPMEEDLQNKWEAAVKHPGKYVKLLVRQCNNKDLRAERDKENHYDSGPWDGVTKNYFLAYHQVKAHACWVALIPNEAENLRRFQVRTCV